MFTLIVALLNLTYFAVGTWWCYTKRDKKNKKNKKTKNKHFLAFERQKRVVVVVLVVTWTLYSSISRWLDIVVIVFVEVIQKLLSHSNNVNNVLSFEQININVAFVKTNKTYDIYILAVTLTYY